MTVIVCKLGLKLNLFWLQVSNSQPKEALLLPDLKAGNHVNARAI